MEAKDAHGNSCALNPAPAATEESTDMDNRPRIIAIQREFFGILDEFFRRATGDSPTQFATFDSFGTKIRTEAYRLASRAPDAFTFVHAALSAFYKKYGIELFHEAKKVGGLSFVLGGSSRFGESQFDSVRKVTLYADTTFIPDPILPWIEDPRAEERFRNVLCLETAFALLQLKPLADADLPYPAVVVFPSYEKSLEKLDTTTQKGIDELTLGILSIYLGRRFTTLAELVSFTATNEGDFLSAIDRHHLYVAPGGEVGQPLQEALEVYLDTIKEWRSDENLSIVSNLSRGTLALNALMERITPQFHLLENAEEMSSCPMVCLPSHWHYYSLACKFFEQRLRAQGVLDERTINTVRSINQPELKWLGNIPVEALVELRQNNENEEFRKALKDRISELHGAALNDLNRITSEVSRSIASLLAAHVKQTADIEGKYQSKYRNIAIGSWVTLAASLVPALAPVVGPIAPLAIGRKYLDTKLKEREERAKAARSLMGVLAAAKEEE